MKTEAKNVIGLQGLKSYAPSGQNELIRSFVGGMGKAEKKKEKMSGSISKKKDMCEMESEVSASRQDGCVCVCVREREREREHACASTRVCVGICAYQWRGC